MFILCYFLCNDPIKFGAPFSDNPPNIQIYTNTSGGYMNSTGHIMQYTRNHEPSPLASAIWLAVRIVFQLPSTQDLKGPCAQWFDYLEGTHLCIHIVFLFPSRPVGQPCLISMAPFIHSMVATGLPNSFPFYESSTFRQGALIPSQRVWFGAPGSFLVLPGKGCKLIVHHCHRRPWHNWWFSIANKESIRENLHETRARIQHQYVQLYKYV